jgi:ABC-type lipoprotein release transport system permease subunit
VPAVGRLAWSQLRFQTARGLALLLGMLLAATAFTVLTAASLTSQLRTVGTVSAHFRPAYDILVRPGGARTALEARTGTVQPNFLSGIYGGITMAQYRQIQNIPGVQVAAPIAMVGYALLTVPLYSQVPGPALAAPGRQLYRVSTTWVSEAGASRVAQPPAYLYVTPHPLRFAGGSGAITEPVPGRGRVQACPLNPPTAGGDPFGAVVQSFAVCWSKVDGFALPSETGTGRTGPGYEVGWVIPVLIAAIDPAAEARLDELDRAVISGRYLAENAGDRPAGDLATFPVLASSSSGMDEYALTRLQRLAPPTTPPVMTVGWMTRQATAPGRTVAASRTTAQQAYGKLLRSMRATTAGARARLGIGAGIPVFGYWSVGPAAYRRTAGGALTPLAVHNPPSVWYTGGAPDVAMDDEDTQYRAVAVHAPPSNTYTTPPGPWAVPRLVGTFDPARIPLFDPLSRVPLGGYEPVVAAPASAASRAALHGGDLLPNQNLGGYVSQPVDLVTTLSALPALHNTGRYRGRLPLRDPISVIRVRVAGVTGPDPVSLERIREAAQEIEQRTHLVVDIVAGSSPSPTAIDLPAGRFGQPALALSEGWVKKGVAVAILTAVDKSSLVLFALILVVCVLFVANSASAAVRGRRHELGVLACLGWTRPRLFGVVLGELSAIGLAAGALGAVAALPLAAALGLHASPARALLAAPVAMGVAIVAGAVPAWLASRAEPVAAVRPPVLAVRRGYHPGGITALAIVNVARTPGRTAIGALALAVGVAGLTMVTAVTAAFRGVVVGSLLGNAVAVQVRGVDYVAVGATIALGVLAIADVVFLNIRERAAELATIRSFGWRESALARLVVTEGSVIGIAGSLAGAALGLAAAAEFAGQLPARLFGAAAVAVAAGVVVTIAAALLPAQWLRRLPVAHLLAEE